MSFSKKLGLVLVFASMATGAAVAQKAGPRFDAERKVFRLDSATTSYVFGVNDRGELQPLYWGARLGDVDTLGPAHSKGLAQAIDSTESFTPQEYAGWGQGYTAEPALKITGADGNRDLVLHYSSHSIDGGVLLVVLKDIERDIFVTLRYAMDADTGILARSAHIENRCKTRFVVDEANAAAWTVPQSEHMLLRNVAGRWGAEGQVADQQLGPGKVVLESRRGQTGHGNNPWFALLNNGANEESGEVWYGALAWSGSWQIAVERDPLAQVRVTGGFNAFDFAYGLAPGESLDTPVFYGGYTQHGMGEVSRTLHRFELAHILPGAPAPKLRPVLYNSWEATRFNLSEAGQMKLADLAAKTGIELFAVDDGWFGKRTTDLRGLGDWTVNKDIFPNGLKPLIDHVRGLGMQFGLWVEPEMVNPDSDLYRAHPDWVLHFNGRPETPARHQLVLNLARPDVRDFVFGFIDKLLSENQISFLKWDYNRNWSEPGWPDIADATTRGEQQKLYVQFYKNLYDVLGRLRAKHPEVSIEDCASGGGRVDLGLLHYTDQVWTSDNSDPFDRLRIQEGFTEAYSPGLMAAWVTDSPGKMNGRVTSITYRYLSSMTGVLGVSTDLSKLSPEDLATSARMIAAYKTVRPTIQRGALYRLISPLGSETAATEYVSPDRAQAVVFAFLQSSQLGIPFPNLHLRGLDPDAKYTLRSIAGKPPTTKTATGAFWMHYGLQPEMKGDFQASAFVLDRVP
jgi:alpha-galactosidase